jgi:hypothetical protein
MKISIVTDLEECESLWRHFVRPEGLFDLWEIRTCFHAHYRYRPRFIVAADAQGPVGLLPLCDITDHGYWGYFPGETYTGKTWLERNRVYSPDVTTCGRMLSACPAATHIRYLVHDPMLQELDARVDEIGYLFHPSDYAFDFANYMNAFSASSRKSLRRERAGLEAKGVSYRYDVFEDVHRLFDLNLEAFGDRSYFWDPRFLAAFSSLAELLKQRGWLRVTTLMVGGEVAAVDMGAVLGGEYLVLAGGTNVNFPGVAKLINFHHLEWACRQRLHQVDFLCGDFCWKERFHLTPRPLYQLRPRAVPSVTAAMGEETLVEIN